jgi:hypothetical protein
MNQKKQRRGCESISLNVPEHRAQGTTLNDEAMEQVRGLSFTVILVSRMRQGLIFKVVSSPFVLPYGNANSTGRLRHYFFHRMAVLQAYK